jgi:signal transduction histidine kinase
MRQLFGNLIGNGLKYQKAGTKPEVKISCLERPEVWEFEVSDNGIGIKESYQSKIFKIFTRLHTQEEYPGTGIGLAMCKRIVDGYGGRIWLESHLGTGTTFHFTLPKKSHEA